MAETVEGVGSVGEVVVALDVIGRKVRMRVVNTRIHSADGDVATSADIP